MIDTGGVISEYPPGTQPVAKQFPARNRIIAGFCDCLVVVEAKEKSGSLITVSFGLEYGKTIYAVNGLTATGMSSLNLVYVKAQSADVVDAYIDHMIVQQVRSGVVINTFYLDCGHRNAEMEFTD